MIQTADNPLNIVDAYNAACDENRKLLAENQELRLQLENASVARDALLSVFLGNAEISKNIGFVPDFIIKVNKRTLPSLNGEEGDKKHGIYIICE